MLETCTSPTHEVDDEQQKQEQPKHDISLVFYYVSWINDNHDTLFIYQQVAKNYAPFINFAAKDCHDLSCNCSCIHRNPLGNPIYMHRWPVLEVYHSQNYLLRYTGEWNCASLSRFMEILMQPIVRVDTKEHLKALSMQRDAVILAYLPNIRDYTSHYAQFIGSAYQFLEIDAQQSFQFAITLGKQAATMLPHTSKEPKIYMITTHAQNESYVPFAYQSKVTWKVRQIVMWLQIIWKRIFPKLYAYSSPSSLALQLHQGPVLALVIQNSLLTDFKNAHCNHYRRIHMDEKCPYDTKTAILNSEQHCLNVDAQQVFNNVIFNLETNYFVGQFIVRNYFAQYLLNSRQKRLADSCHIQHELPIENRIKLSKNIKAHIEQLTANKNKTLTVVVLDAVKHKDLLDKQQINLQEDVAITAFIADKGKESIYLLQKRYILTNLLKFIREYLENELFIHRLEQKTILQLHENAIVHKLNSKMFLNLLHQKNLTIIALQHAPNCVFCALTLQAMQQIAAMLNLPQSENNNNKISANLTINNILHLKFISIDIQKNDLPWELNVGRTPILTVFPRGAYAESRTFPTHTRANIRNIFAFIVAQLEPLEQLQLTLKMCRQKMPTMRLQNCLQFMQELVLQHIGQHLKYWQSYENERTILLQQLNNFRNINLDVQRYLSY